MYGLPSVSERLQALDDDVDVLHGCLAVENALECGRIETGRDLWIDGDEGPEVAILVPGLHRVPLHDPVGIAAVEPSGDEGEQQPVREHEAVRSGDVPEHSLR